MRPHWHALAAKGEFVLLIGFTSERRDLPNLVPASHSARARAFASSVMGAEQRWHTSYDSMLMCPQWGHSTILGRQLSQLELQV